MASGPTTFITLMVFTAEKFQGNPLAVVSVRANSLTQQRKAQVAKEFKYSETVFIHDAPGPGLPRRLEIFTETGEEIPFAGHPVIGAAYYILGAIEKLPPSTGPADRDTQRQSAVFMTKAGPVPVFFNPYRSITACSVPHKVHIHSKSISFENVTAVQPQILIIPTIEAYKNKTFPVVSIVKGMTFALIDLTDAPEIFTALEAGKAPEVDLDGEWSPSYVGCMYYLRKSKAEQTGEPTIHNIQARMISHGIEDPGTGSGCSALACYLSLEEADEKSKTTTETEGDENPSGQNSNEKGEEQKQNEVDRKVFGIQQGVEMGRICTIAVEVDVKRGSNGKSEVSNVILSGRCHFHSRGELVGL